MTQARLRRLDKVSLVPASQNDLALLFVFSFLHRVINYYRTRRAKLLDLQYTTSVTLELSKVSLRNKYSFRNKNIIQEKPV